MLAFIITKLIMPRPVPHSPIANFSREAYDEITWNIKTLGVCGFLMVAFSWQATFCSPGTINNKHIVINLFIAMFALGGIALCANDLDKVVNNEEEVKSHSSRIFCGLISLATVIQSIIFSIRLLFGPTYVAKGTEQALPIRYKNHTKHIIEDVISANGDSAKDNNPSSLEMITETVNSINPVHTR